MKCANCSVEIFDGAQCGLCKKHLGFCCAGITEIGHRKLRAERKAAWRCPSCKKDASPVRDPVTLESIMNELQDMKRQLSDIPTLVHDIKNIRKEIADVQASCDFTSRRLDDCCTRLDAVEAKVSNVTDLQDKVTLLDNEVKDLKWEFASRDQWQRMNNVEIKGVPSKKNENLFTILEDLGKVTDFQIERSQINYISRVPTFNSKDKSIIVTFNNRYVKENFVASARVKKSILASEVGFKDSTNKIFVNDHLTAEYKKLLTETKTILKAKKFQYIWVKYCKIHVRKDDESKVIAENVRNWVRKLKDFTTKYEDICCDPDVDIKKRHVNQVYVTGSSYRGQRTPFGMNGRGVYTYPDGVTYKGGIVDDIWQGNGRLTFPDGTILKGCWYEGMVTEPVIIMQDELFHNDDQKYCFYPDRRYCSERRKCCIEPPNKSQLTNDDKAREIPPGYYDEGSGFFNPKLNAVVHYDDLSRIIRMTAPEESQWIKNHCRQAPEPIVGPANWLYEQWAELKRFLFEPVECTLDDYGYSNSYLYDQEKASRVEAGNKLLEKRLLPKALPVSKQQDILEFNDTEDIKISNGQGELHINQLAYNGS